MGSSDDDDDDDDVADDDLPDAYDEGLESSASSGHEHEEEGDMSDFAVDSDEESRHVRHAQRESLETARGIGPSTRPSTAGPSTAEEMGSVRTRSIAMPDQGVDETDPKKLPKAIVAGGKLTSTSAAGQKFISSYWNRHYHLEMDKFYSRWKEVPPEQKTKIWRKFKVNFLNFICIIVIFRIFEF